MSANFKTCMFGGFDREDVISYIETSAREAQERIDALEKENGELKAGNEQLRQELRTMHAQVRVQERDTHEQLTLRQQLEEAQARAAALAAENETLTAQNTTLAAQNERMRPAAEECTRLKERIADIEINAHRRTEEFRTGAIAELRRLIGEQRAWCQERQGQYAALNESILQELHRAESIVGSTEVSGFDTMLAGLQQLEDTLQ